ncbi:MAG: 4-hydroxy-tetrahydrodipicolinate reductase [Syntrophobacterales bacterium]|nr:MAG: 4-hydroxy-tetrahydrodipicolinate reductase [Syntrophobacterales bacterium]
MIRAIVVGAAGRMGGRIIHTLHEAEGIEVSGAVERPDHPFLNRDIGEVVGGGEIGVPLEGDIERVIEAGDVVIDFTNPEVSLRSLEVASESGAALVVGSTGFTPQQMEKVAHLAKKIRCVLSPNMSVGVNLMFKLAGEVARILGDEYDVEILEAHHRFKKDSPSGTAMKLGEVVASALNRDFSQVGIFERKGVIGERKPQEIGMQAVRAGDIVGDHTVIFGGLGERLELTHRAHSRDNFARGAVRAAKWVITQPNGVYDMGDVLGLK